MSVSTAARVVSRPIARPAARPGPQPPRLRVVAPARQRSAGALAVLCITLLAAGLMALLMLNISIGKGAYQLTALQRQQRQLTVDQQALAEQVEALRAPQALARRARELGMVPAPNTVFLTLPGGGVQGTPATALAPPKPKAAPTPEEKPAGTKPGSAKTDAKAVTTKTGTTKTGTAQTGRSKGDTKADHPKPIR